MNTQVAKRMSLAAVVVMLGCMTGCATMANNPKDPFEGFNRAMFSVNEGIDFVVKPVAEGYDKMAPMPVKAGIGNFFGNLSDIWTALNNFLQFKGGEGLSDVARVLINSTLGIGGLFDVASEMELEKHAEDFGQTLGSWGVEGGPYLFWPVIGPRTLRDTVGFAFDSYADPVMRIEDISTRNVLAGVRFIDLRASMLPADKVVEEAAFDKYNYIRDAYLQNRRSVIFDGNPPPLDE